MKASTLLQITGVLALLLAAVTMVRFYPDIMRYLKMKSM